jgi:pSer/pThr/pTyr-binding forkhead associated (FHA) protein
LTSLPEGCTLDPRANKPGGAYMETEIVNSPSGLFLEQARPPSSRHWQLDGDRMAIGRDPSSAIYVDDTSISRHHADLIRHGLSWLIVDARSTNGTFVNDTRVNKVVLQTHDRIRLGQIELVVRQSGVGPQGHQANAVRYDVGWQQGNISNIAGSQSNYYHESNLRYIASRRGRARLLIVWGILLFLAGNGLGLFDVLNFDKTVFNSINSNSFNPPQLPALFIPLIGVAAFMNLLGIALFIFGLIARSGAKREARRLGADGS